MIDCDKRGLGFAFKDSLWLQCAFSNVRLARVATPKNIHFISVVTTVVSIDIGSQQRLCVDAEEVLEALRK